MLERSTLAERRPVDEPETIRGMLAHADIIVTARSAAYWSASPGRLPITAFAPTSRTSPSTKTISGAGSARS